MPPRDLGHPGTGINGWLTDSYDARMTHNYVPGVHEDTDTPAMNAAHAAHRVIMETVPAADPVDAAKIVRALRIAGWHAQSEHEAPA